MARFVSLSVLVCFCLFTVIFSLNGELDGKLSKAIDATKSAIDAIHKEWQVDEFPNFRKSCFMPKISWEIMKLKYQQKVVSSFKTVGGAEPVRFTISFTGSSVTAGHDNHFNTSAPIVTGTLMEASFAPLGIQLVTKNVALGNNPCTPYDVCVKCFAGVDADIVHWEQTYFCADNRPVIEQFIRQAIAMPSKPIVVFSDSHSGQWKAAECAKKAAHVVTEAEKLVLKADPLHLVSEINKDELQHRWGWLAEHVHTYHSGALQTFQHLNHEAYACQGPYIPEWNKGAASWHPSVIAHRMRAAHHAYFWLLNWLEALTDLRAQLSHRVVEAIEKDVDHRLEKLMTPMGPARHKSAFPDNAVCYTDYEPRNVREASLKDRVISGLETPDKKGWKHMIYEDMVDHNLVLNSLRQGYKDFKYLIHGNKDSGPLSFAIPLSKESPIFLCETPGIWGGLPKGYDHLWLNVVEAFITYNVPDKAAFEFKTGAATKLEVAYDKTNELCVSVKLPGSTVFPAGNHVLTVAATTPTQIILAWIITA